MKRVALFLVLFLGACAHNSDAVKTAASPSIAASTSPLPACDNTTLDGAVEQLHEGGRADCFHVEEREDGSFVVFLLMRGDMLSPSELREVAYPGFLQSLATWQSSLKPKPEKLDCSGLAYLPPEMVGRYGFGLAAVCRPVYPLKL